MEHTLSSLFSINSPCVTVSPSFTLKNNPRPAFSGFSVEKRRRFAVVVSGASSYGGFCEFSILNTPIEPVTSAGRYLSSVLLNERKSFHDAAARTLEKLVEELDEAYVRRSLSVDSTEACLHRRIAELKGRECQTAIEDIMYILIFYKFSEIKVHLIPRLSKCIYNGRLEILPSKDWELESIHSFEILEMIREHLTSVIGWRSDFSVTDNWATTQINRLNLSQIYKSSILFGYFLKSVALRHQLETSLADPVDDIVLTSGTHLPLREFYKCQQKNLVFGHTRSVMSMSAFEGKKKTGFSPDLLSANPNSEEALNLISRHSCALFGDSESDEVISTSFATLKRFVLEGIAFGSFLWDTEEYVKTVYKLKEK